MVFRHGTGRTQAGRIKCGVPRPQKLGDAYVAAKLPVLRRRLYQASARLAMRLNEAFPEQRHNGVQLHCCRPGARPITHVKFAGIEP